MAFTKRETSPTAKDSAKQHLMDKAFEERRRIEASYKDTVLTKDDKALNRSILDQCKPHREAIARAMDILMESTDIDEIAANRDVIIIAKAKIEELEAHLKRGGRVMFPIGADTIQSVATAVDEIFSDHYGKDGKRMMLYMALSSYMNYND